MMAAGSHLYVDIHVAKPRLDPSDALASGATITGTLWLQGCLAEQTTGSEPVRSVESS
jgi:hypothetical protein